MTPLKFISQNKNRIRLIVLIPPIRAAQRLRDGHTDYLTEGHADCVYVCVYVCVCVCVFF